MKLNNKNPSPFGERGWIKINNFYLRASLKTHPRVNKK